ncbi:dipeptidase [Pseudochrobactrum sp. sp1633]|uniref:dipeptidase n=1 Tax=Pseudochrobactrum sp. sp1633 TaxID=3036706 RepID=UPI0025A59D55|nr:dipeptidase [Pseudochrobactrum sp. sp1633]MDM8347180.1 dipeptidase [Pseudochrobactrum sp. sp1633]
MTDLHDNAVVIDGLIVSKWSREVFEDMRRGGLTAANCTCSIWEGFQATINNVTTWNKMFKDNSDLIMQVTKASDILAAKKQNKTGIILGFQNVSAFEDQIGYVEIFKKLGVGIVQMAYNTQNLIGTGCYETVDRGLSDFGREIVAEMNRVGILCDLSHVGAKTSEDVILTSSQPVCYSHCLPSGLKQHPRNKTDEQLKFIADRGGFVGVTMFPPFLAKGTNSTIDDYVTAIDYVTNLIGEDCVGIGTDFTQGHGEDFFEWLTHDKGYARQLTEFGEIKGLSGIETIGDFPNLTRAMQKAGWNSTKIEKIIGGNWLRLLTNVWGE